MPIRKLEYLVSFLDKIKIKILLSNRFASNLKSGSSFNLHSSDTKRDQYSNNNGRHDVFYLENNVFLLLLLLHSKQGRRRGG